MKCILISFIAMLVILAGSAVCDVRDHRIPNRWLAGGVLLGLLIQLWLGIGQEEQIWRRLLWYVLRILAVAAVWAPVFHVRMMGAGDIKQMALICGILGLYDGSISILYGFLTGAVMALVKLLVQRSLAQRLSYLFAYIKRIILTKEVVAYHIPARDGYGSTIPFGLCLFIGTLVYFVTMNH